jgi:hypothetical protein
MQRAGLAVKQHAAGNMNIIAGVLKVLIQSTESMVEFLRMVFV